MPSSNLAPQSPASPLAPQTGQTGQDQSYISDLESEAGELKERLPEEKSRLDAMKPPELQEVPPPTVQPTDPKQIWGSAAMMLSILGGFLTRQPLTTALNAAAGVFKAYRKKDQAAADQAFQTWKAASENAVKMAEFQQKQLEDAREQYKDDLNGYFAAVKGIAAEHHNEQLDQIAREKNKLMAMNYELGLKRFSLLMAESGEKLTEQHQFQMVLADLQKSPEYQKAGSLGRAKMIADAAAEINPVYIAHADKVSAAVAEAQKKEAPLYKAALDDIAAAREVVIKYPQAVGAWGQYVQKPIETIAGVTRMEGAHAAEPTHELETRIAHIQASISHLVRKSMYMSKAAREQLDDMVRGTGFWDTPQSTLQSLDLMEGVLREQMGEESAKASIGVPGETQDYSNTTDDEIKRQFEETFGFDIP